MTMQANVRLKAGFYLFAAIWFGAQGATGSNGWISAGFALMSVMCIALMALHLADLKEGK